MRDLFFRQTRLSIDQVERLKKRVESVQAKLNSVRDAQKDGWGAEAEKLVQSIETDQASITAQLNRRVYIRAWSASLRLSYDHTWTNRHHSVCGMSYGLCYTTGNILY